MQTELQLPHTASQVFLMTFHTQHQITFLTLCIVRTIYTQQLN